MNDQDLERGMSSMTSFIVGAAVGAGLALLLAPDRGSETRRRLGQTARRLSSQMRDGMDDIKDNVKSAVDSGRDAFRRERDTMRSETTPGGITNP
jgi:gas vesicle protein